MSRAIVILGALAASLCLAGVEGTPTLGYGRGGFGSLGLGSLGYGGLGYGGLGYGGLVEEIVEPVIPVSSGLVDARSYTDSYFPGSSYCGYGTYGPAYGGAPYPLGVYDLQPYHYDILERGPYLPYF